MPNDGNGGDDAMGQRPRLVLPPVVEGEPYVYQCSQCGQRFLPPEDRSPKEGVLEMWVAFKQHVQAEHCKGAERAKGRGNDASEKR
jgi:hypothetical protein